MHALFYFGRQGKDDPGQFYLPVYNMPKSKDGRTWDFTNDEKIWTTIAGDFDGDSRTDFLRTYHTYQHGFFPRGDNEKCWFRNSDIPLECFYVSTFYYPGTSESLAYGYR